jgi:hypothetical protein
MQSFPARGQFLEGVGYRPVVPTRLEQLALRGAHRFRFRSNRRFHASSLSVPPDPLVPQMFEHQPGRRHYRPLFLDQLDAADRQHRDRFEQLARAHERYGEPGREPLAVPARQLAVQPGLPLLPRHPRPLLLRLEQTRRPALDHHVDRLTRMGIWVLINEI